jgi:hypothetical protein
LVVPKACQWPTPRLVKSAIEAERLAAEWMVALGFQDAQVTPVGSDGGIDVTSSSAVAQVKMEGVATGRPQVQALSGAASVKQKAPLFFSLAGYTRHALEWAERAHVACFEFAHDGSLEPRTNSAWDLMHGSVSADGSGLS